MGHRDLNPQDEASYMLHMAQIQKEKGVPQEAQRILIDFDAQVWESVGVWGEAVGARVFR